MASITIAKDYLDTLLRRAELHHTSVDAITITKAEHDALLRVQREYNVLRTTLIAGGVPQQTLDILANTSIPKFTSDRSPPDGPRITDSPHTASPSPRLDEKTLTRNQRTRLIDNQLSHNIFGDRTPSNSQSASLNPDSYAFDYEDRQTSVSFGGKACPVQESNEMGAKFENNRDRRSVILRGILERTTLKDLTDVIRGGQVLNLFIRPRARTAVVTFVEATAAETFFNYARHSYMFILGKRVEAAWNDHQYYLPGHIAHKIFTYNATRNLVIRSPRSDMTDIVIRNDLEHIDGLHVVEIRSEQGNIYVSLNAITHAITARSCMSSRLRYKGCNVQYSADECAQPLPPVLRKHTRTPRPASPKNDFHGNRFRMLASNATSDEDELEKFVRHEEFGRGDWTGQTLPG